MLDEINEAYPDGDAWRKCLDEEKVEYISAFCKEVLRFWTVIPMSLPRVSIKDVIYQGARIPAGTTFLMVCSLLLHLQAILLSHTFADRILTWKQNAWAADYDTTHFESPHVFSPERFLNIPEGSGTQHFAFGAGSRMCTGSHLANREMYITFMRILLAFEILPAKDAARRPILDGPLDCNANPSGLSIEPKPFDIGFKIRDRKKLEEWCEQTRSVTSYMLD